MCPGEPAASRRPWGDHERVVMGRVTSLHWSRVHTGLEEEEEEEEEGEGEGEEEEKGEKEEGGGTGTPTLTW